VKNSRRIRCSKIIGLPMRFHLIHMAKPRQYSTHVCACTYSVFCKH
jgi:hypothetical protein